MFQRRRKPGKRWLVSDTLLARALDLHEASMCPECGQYRDETFDPLNDGDNPYRTGEYVASELLRDHACTALARARVKLAKADYPHPSGLRFGISRKPIGGPHG